VVSGSSESSLRIILFAEETTLQQN